MSYGLVVALSSEDPSRSLASLPSDRFPNHTFLPIRTALYRDVEAAEKQCKELEKVVALIENNRQRFRHIDNVRLF